MPEYKLTYFNGRGLGELARWLLAYADIEYTDERINFEDWPALKSQTPNGALPIFEVDGKKIPQSFAISRYLARQAKLLPEDSWDNAVCDALADTYQELFAEARNIRNSSTEESERQQKFKEVWWPKYAVPLVEKIEKSLEGKEWFVGDMMSWGDFIVASFTDSWQVKEPGCMDKYKNCLALTEKVTRLPAIKSWIEKRPKTVF